MNKIFNLFLILTTGAFITSCSKDDAVTPAPQRDYVEQYVTDSTAIEAYIDTHYITVDSDYNVTLTAIPSGGTQESIREQQTYPLAFKMVENSAHKVNYKVYYLNLREGIKEQPTAVDSVYVSYKGSLLDDTQFDVSPSPVWFQLESVVSGWADIIPLFKTGNYDTTPGPNPADFTDFGVGVMFLPSGLAYYAQSPSALVPQYSPLVFSFKLNNLRFRDHDRDKVLSKNEVDASVLNQHPKSYDTDGDGIPNYLDTDDDNDRYLTKTEILINGSVPSFDAILNCSGTTGGTKKHLDPACH
jgi:hypothetical protein